MTQPLPIILAAGKCSRFYPYADETSHKSMVFLAGKPILQYTAEGLKKSGFNEIVIIINSSDKKIREYFGEGQNFGIKINYVIQEKALGMGNALLCAKDFIKEDFLLLNANQININEFVDDILNLKNQEKCVGVILGKKEEAKERYGMFELNGNKAVKIIEKPKPTITQNIRIIENVRDIRVVGIYLLNKNFIKILEKTKQSENSLEDALNKYFPENDVRVLVTEKETFSLKYPWDLFKIKNYILRNLPNYISEKAQIKKGAIIKGDIYIESGAIIYENAVIKGPCYIGKNVIIGNFSLLRECCIMEENSLIGCYAEMKNAILMKNSSMHSGFIGDSVIGENSHLGAGFISANKRFDNQDIKVDIKNNKINSGLKKLGAFIGSDVNIGIQSATMPGVIIGNRSIIYPGKKIFENIENNALIK